MASDITYHCLFRYSDSFRSEDITRIKRQLEKMPLLSDVYVIVFRQGAHDPVEFFHSRQLSQRYYKKNPPVILAIVKDYAEAVTMVQYFVNECLKKRGDCNLKEYFL